MQVFDTLGRDFRNALRTLRHKRSVTAVAILSLALAIAANTAVFTAVDVALFQTLPFAEADRIVTINGADTKRGILTASFSYARWKQLLMSNERFAEIGAYCREAFNLTGGSRPERANAARISSGLLPALGVEPVIGRNFAPDEDVVGGKPVLLISSRLWNSRYGHATTVIDSTIQLDSGVYSIIGVAPDSLQLVFKDVDLFLPNVRGFAVFTPEQIEAGAGYLQALARLKPGVDLNQAQVEMNVLNDHYRTANPKLVDAGPDFEIRVTPIREQLVHDIRPTLVVLWWAVTFVLLIACANVASLLVARAVARTREIAIRSAIGARPGQILRQLLVEGLALSIISGIIGVSLAQPLTGLLLMNHWTSTGFAGNARMDSTVLVFTAGICVLTGIFISLFPALQLRRIDMNGILREGGREMSASGRGTRFRNILVAAQAALSMILLIGSGLIIRTIVNLQTTDLGFDQRNVVTMQLTLPGSMYSTPAQKRQFFSRVVASVETIPEVHSAAVSLFVPLRARARAPILPDDSPPIPLSERQLVLWQSVTPGYFRTLNIRLDRGRVFDEHDDEQAPEVAIANETFARQFWSGQDPIGKRVMISRNEMHCEIVGVIADVKNSGVDKEAAAEIYTSFAQRPWPFASLLVRTDSAPTTISQVIQERIREIDQEMPVFGIESMDHVVQDTYGDRRTLLVVLGAFSVTALLLVGIGIYATSAYWVAARRHELGIRIALGAQKRDILRLVVSKGLVLILAGITAGAVAAVALSRLLVGMIYKVTPYDPSVFCAAGLLLVSIALISMLGPAWRAARLDPTVCLRDNVR
jgi:putative ABC transport system permease protein